MEENKLVVTKERLLEAGAYFGHNARKLNPKMKEYTLAQKRGENYLIDCDIIAKKLTEAYEVIRTIVQNGGKILFVGTRKLYQEVIKEEAVRSGQYFVDQRWLGGTLTNRRTMLKNIAKLADIETKETDGTFEKLTKKEVAAFKHEKERLMKFFSGIRGMTKLPDAIYIVDPKSEHNAVAEARKLNIPIFGLVDVNCDPDVVDYIIPANDDALKSVHLITATIANAIVEGNGGTPIEIVLKEEPKEEEKVEKPSKFMKGKSKYIPRREEKPRQRVEAPKAEYSTVEEEKVSGEEK